MAHGSPSHLLYANDDERALIEIARRLRIFVGTCPPLARGARASVLRHALAAGSRGDTSLEPVSEFNVSLRRRASCAQS